MVLRERRRNAKPCSIKRVRLVCSFAAWDLALVSRQSSIPGWFSCLPHIDAMQIYAYAIGLWREKQSLVFGIIIGCSQLACLVEYIHLRCSTAKGPIT